MKLVFDDDSYVIENKGDDTFFVGFNQNLILRESCYRCKYAGTDRITDFTMADFWGVTLEDVTEEQLKNGVSAFTVNTNKAEKLLAELNNTLEYKLIDQEKVISHNLAFVRPQPRPKERDIFFKKLEKHDYDAVIHSLRKKFYTKIWIKNTLKRILGERYYKKFKDFYHSIREHV